MSQRSGHQPGPAEPQLCSQCQCCQPGWAHTAVPKLFWSVSLLHMFPNFVMCLHLITTRLYKWGTVTSESRVRETGRGGGSEGDKGQSHTIKLCSVGLQRPTSYSHAVLHSTNPSPYCLWMVTFSSLATLSKSPPKIIWRFIISLPHRSLKISPSKMMSSQ